MAFSTGKYQYLTLGFNESESFPDIFCNNTTTENVTAEKILRIGIENNLGFMSYLKNIYKKDVHIKTGNKLEQTETSQNELQGAATSWNELKPSRRSWDQLQGARTRCSYQRLAPERFRTVSYNDTVQLLSCIRQKI